MSESSKSSRRRRVQIIKRMILYMAVFMILLPTLLCIVLFMKVHKAEKEIEFLYAANIRLMENSDMVIPPGGQEGIIAQNGTAEESGDPGLAEAEEQEDAAAVFYEGYDDNIRRVYLTFDDGPSVYTERILDILKEYNVKATFFVVGKEDEQYRALYQRIVDEGHTLGMHSYSHMYSKIYSSAEAFADDLKKLQDFLYEVTGVRSNIWRFPGGSSNHVSKVDMQELIAYLEEEGITYYDWNISSRDAAPSSLSAANIVSNATTGLGSEREIIILMHDAADKATTVEALPSIIEFYLSMADMELLPITEKTRPIQHLKPVEK